MSATSLEDLIEQTSVSMAAGFAAAAERAHSEEDVRHSCNALIDTFIDAAGLQIIGRHEYGLAGGRIDSKYAGVLIEYKDPRGSGRLGQFSDFPGVIAVVTQLKRRFRDFLKHEHVPAEKLLGVGTDGRFLVFVRARGTVVEPEQPVPVSPGSVATVLRAIVALGVHGRSYTPEDLAETFGSAGAVARQSVRALYESISQTPEPRSQTLLRQWRVLFGEVCGYKLDKPTPALLDLAEGLGLRRDIRPAEFLFALQTYYAFVMKVLAGEVVSSVLSSEPLVARLRAQRFDPEQTRDELRRLEANDHWAGQGITNFLEGDLFAWYVDAWTPDIHRALVAVLDAFDQYDPDTLSVDPDDTRDLLKHLYQDLVDSKTRHDLGEYYTPDWLADRLLDDMDYSGDPNIRALDPACGSGTFLVLMLRRVKEWNRSRPPAQQLPLAELARLATRNVVGFDLNPLAVLAARTNYLIAVREWLRPLGSLEIPVFLCDSLLVPENYSSPVAGTFDYRVLHTAVGTFYIPETVIKEPGSLARYCSLLEEMVPNSFTASDFVRRVRDSGLTVGPEARHVTLFDQLQKLHRDGKDGIWPRIIKNAFAPLFTRDMDLIVGNPPWILWDSLAPEYKTQTTPLWRKYGLFSLSGMDARLGGAKKDVSMLFVYYCADTYLRDEGRLGFLITRSLLKSAKAGAGFRRFRFATGGVTYYLRPDLVEDLSDLQPFEDASTMTASIALTKTQKPFAFPVPYDVWSAKPRAGIRYDSTLAHVLKVTDRDQRAASPIDRTDPTSQWFAAPQPVLLPLQQVNGRSPYKAHEGVNSGGLNGCFWVEVQDWLQPGAEALVMNLRDVGKTELSELRDPMRIETDLLYPLVRGSELRRWHYSWSCFVVLAQDVNRRDGIPLHVMKTRYPKTFRYFHKFEEKLRSRALFKKFHAGSPDYWAMFNVGPYTVREHRVAWPRIATSLQACVLQSVPVGDGSQTRPVLCQETHTFVDFDSQDEAHYFCALLNSAPADLLIRCTTGSKGFGSPGILDMIAIPRFDPSSPIHQDLADASRRVHALAENGATTEAITSVEHEINRLAGTLWSIAEPAIAAIEGYL